MPACDVVLVAAGRGSRFGGSDAKQFAPLAGRPLYMHSLEVFGALDFVNQIVLVTPAGGLPARAEAQMAAVVPEVIRVRGGDRRQDSVAAGLAALRGAAQVVLVHDVARPFPPPAAIEKLAVAAVESGGGLLATPCTDTVKVGTAEGHVERTLDRRRIWLAQTPQAIRADLVARAAVHLRQLQTHYTDEAALLESWGVRVALIESGPENFKITHPADLARAEAMMRPE